MKTLVLASQKGGSGKTTLAAHIAVAAEVNNESSSVLIDMDPQGSLSEWWNSRKKSSPALASTSLIDLPEKLLSLKKAGFSLAIIDTPPAITTAIRDVIKLADLVLIPTRPSPHDLRAVGSTVALVKESKKQFLFVVSQAKQNARLTAQSVAVLSEHGSVVPVIVHDRVDFASSMIDGHTVQEIDKKCRSSNEIIELFSFVQKRLHERKIKRKKKRV